MFFDTKNFIEQPLGLAYSRSSVHCLKYGAAVQRTSSFLSPVDPVFIYSGGEDNNMTPYQCLKNCMAQQLHQVGTFSLIGESLNLRGTTKTW